LPINQNVNRENTMQPCAARVPFLLLLLAPCASFGAEEYWAYSYKNIDITAAGTSAYAVNLAHYCVRLDALLSRILGIKRQSRVPIAADSEDRRSRDGLARLDRSQ
jgi:hypothetical protein